MRSTEGYREKRKEVADSGKGTNEKETTMKIGNGSVSRGLTIQRGQVSKLLRILDGKKQSSKENKLDTDEKRTIGYESSMKVRRGYVALGKNL